LKAKETVLKEVEAVVPEGPHVQPSMDQTSIPSPVRNDLLPP